MLSGKWLDVESAHGDILRNGFLPGYTEWNVHGEHTIFFGQEDIIGLVRDALELLRDTFPHLTALPSSAYEAKKFTKDLGLGYEKIHACPNDCMLYWDDRAGQQSCHICKSSRYKSDEVGGSSKSRKSNKPAKVLRYFPLIPRLKRLYKCEKTAKDMRWHDTGRTKDGKLRHPADGLAWSAFNDRYSKFASDPRSVRLGLASDGFNPFGTMSTSHSTWPVLLIPYNLPPWICMKRQSFILSSIIPGEKAPGNDIDVYLKPLIKELQLLWKGVDAYDAFSKQHFKLKASLMWTINDFPAYANLSGWSTKGRVACPVCANSTHSRWLKHGKKICYMGHRRWLKPNHSCRFQKERFDGTVENRGPPTPLTGSDVLKQLSGIRFKYGKSKKSNIKASSLMVIDSSQGGMKSLRRPKIQESCKSRNIKQSETGKKQLASQNKKVESYKKQVETQDLQMKNMEQKLNEVYGMLKLLPAFPNLDNVASTSAAAGTCDKQPFSSPSPFMDEDHYLPVMEHPSFGY
ncbi:hypothetical protein Tco_0441596 [Tanacetum coccineum]